MTTFCTKYFPQGFSDEGLRDLMPDIARVLESLSQRQPFVEHDGGSCFMHPGAFPISLAAFLFRIWKYSECSTSCFLAALVYIDRLISRKPNFAINPTTIHRLALIAIMTAAKFLDDLHEGNGYFSAILGAPREEINKMEREFLILIDYNLCLDPQTFHKYYASLCEYSKLTKSDPRPHTAPRPPGQGPVLSSTRSLTSWHSPSPERSLSRTASPSSCASHIPIRTRSSGQCSTHKTYRTVHVRHKSSTLPKTAAPRQYAHAHPDFDSGFPTHEDRARQTFTHIARVAQRAAAC